MVPLIDNCNYAFVCSTDDVSDSQLQKLHIQFGHYSEDKSIQLLLNACKSKLSKHERETLEHISGSCEICRKHGRCQPKPVVALPMATRFNQCVSMYLHELTEFQPHIWYFHMVDVFTRFSNACIVRTNKPGTAQDGAISKAQKDSKTKTTFSTTGDNKKALKKLKIGERSFR